MSGKKSQKHYGPGEHVKLEKLEPTDEKVFRARRKLIKTAAYSSVFAAAAGVWAYRGWTQIDYNKRILQPGVQNEKLSKLFPFKRHKDFDREDAELTERLAAATHNNFYEFLPGQGGPVWKLTNNFEVEPWTLEITGECRKPTKFSLDDLFTKFDNEERVYRHRCVETWAMVVPWSGFQLSKLLDAVEPTNNAKFVKFTTAENRDQMPGIEQSIKQRMGYPWPYYEGLRIDEAMNELALLVTGIYGKPMPKQHGAPIRLVIPWKYGYKSIKSIVKIELLREQPGTFWADAAGGSYRHEYGFLSNVNPNIPHPRWSQATEYMLSLNLDARFKRVPTTIFNGYADHVGKLYPDEPTKPIQALRFGKVAR